MYYANYVERVLNELELIFKKQDKDDVVFLFVVNNERLYLQLGTEPKKTHIIRGSNKSGEFSAWDEGLSYLSNIYDINDDDVLFFLNDTFCHHRIFGSIDRNIYRKLLISPKHDVLYGEVNSTNSFFCIYNRKMNSWITSYFFMGRKKVIDVILPLDKTSLIRKENINFIFQNVKKGFVSIDFFSDELNGHLTKWLFPKNGKGWHRSKLICSPENKFFKLKAIINEKLLSYSVMNNEFALCDIYSSPLMKIYNKSRYKLYNALRKIKKTH